jgi:signal peptidase II
VSEPAPALTRGRAWLYAGAAAAGVLILDQVAKALVRSNLEPGERVDLAFGFDLTRLTNSGIAFGLFEDGGAALLAVTIAALAAVLVWFALDPARPGFWLAAGLLVGGAAGNLVDRVSDSAVTDFIDPPYWPAFNLADVAITLGAITLAVVAFRAPAKESEPEAAP